MQNVGRRAFIAVIVGVLLASLTVASPASAQTPNVFIDANFESVSFNPYRNYGQDQIRIQQPQPEALPLLDELNLTNERGFVRLDQWKPGRNDDLNTDPSVKFTVGDTWLQEMNARGVAPWLTQENLPNWIKPPLNDADIANYEQLWYEIVLHIKTVSPQTRIIEMMNEPNIAKFNIGFTDQVKLYVSNAKVVNRINDELNLPQPGSPKLISGGPSYTFAAAKGSLMTRFLDALYARDDFEEIKPAFISWHTFSSKSAPAGLRTTAEKIDAYMADEKFNGAWDGVPQWVTAYGQSKCTQNRKNPSPFNMMKHASFFAAAHHQMMNGGVERGSLFATSNYRCYDGTVLLPEPVAPGKAIGWAQPDMKTPLFNALQLMARLGDGQRINAIATGNNALNANGQGVGVEATRERGEANVLIWNYRTTGSTRFHSTAQVDLTGLEGACIADDEDALAVVSIIDDMHSNVAVGDHSEQEIHEEPPVLLPAGQPRTLTIDVRNGAVIAIEVTRVSEEPIPDSCQVGFGEPEIVVPGTSTTPTVYLTRGPNTATIIWDPVAGADRYRVRYRAVGDPWGAAVRYDEIVPVTFTELIRGKRYNVAVGARINGKWKSQWTVVTFRAE